ncbi:ISAs1 family transposase, partial [Serratia microhaemolytica]|uniref:ISAs1 family transposase n=1 Tax=Serratia microhaemolytica TaxID=2675110 RepID=UPI000FDD5C4A
MALFEFIEMRGSLRRKDINKKHKLVDVIFLVFSAVLSGASGWKSIQEFGELQLGWLKQYAPFENGIPRRHCIANIIRTLDSDILVEALFLWINERRVKDGKKLIAIDGKTMRGTRKTSILQALHVVSAYDVGAGIALYQKATESKGKEGPIGREIIRLLALENAIVTMDALHCQVKTLDLITQRKGDYIVGVKNNQKQLYQFVKERFSAAYDTEEFAEFTEQNKGHGRLEQRIVMQLPADLPDDLKQRWPSIRSLIEVVSERGKPGD